MIVAITGNFCSGKSTLSGYLRALGAKVIDVDGISNRLWAGNNEVRLQIKKEFGSIEKDEIAKRVFKDKACLERLEAILHPYIKKEIRLLLHSYNARGYRYIVLDIPLLFEAEMASWVDKIVVVRCPLDKQIKWAREKWRFSLSLIQERIDSQMDIEKKVRLADYVIENNKDKSFLKSQAEELWFLLSQE